MLWNLTLDTKDSTFCLLYVSYGFPWCFSGKEPTCLFRRHEIQVSSLGQEDPLEEGVFLNPLQYSCLDNLMDRGAWGAIHHGVTESGTQLSAFFFSLSLVIFKKAFFV